MVHMYALVRHPAVVPDVVGIDGGALEVVAIDPEIDAVVSDSDGGAAPTDAAILAHARVIDAVAAENESVLPARYAGPVAAADLQRQLGTRRDDITAALERVAGCVELGLRVLPAAGEARPAAAASGAEYMRRRLGEVGSAEALARELDAALAPIARESACRVLARRDVLLTAAYLVARDDVEDFRAAVAAVERPGITIVSTGPWAPYSFTLLEAEQ